MVIVEQGGHGGLTDGIGPPYARVLFNLHCLLGSSQPCIPIMIFGNKWECSSIACLLCAYVILGGGGRREAFLAKEVWCSRCSCGAVDKLRCGPFGLAHNQTDSRSRLEDSLGLMLLLKGTASGL